MIYSRFAVQSVCVAATLAGCASDPHVTASEGEPQLSADSDSSTVLTAELVVAAPANLPTCTSTLGGTTAYVQQNQSLYTCARGSWSRQTCTVDRAGEVAFVTGESFLLACSAKRWTQVALPTGDAGTAGTNALVATSPEPAGANCASGGLRVASGPDSNRNTVLDGNEVAATSFVCNGSNGAAGGTAAPVRSQARAATVSECPGGGQVIVLYQDVNTNGVPDSGESAGDPIRVCNGDPVAANGTAPVVKSYQDASSGDVAGEGPANTVTVLDATITTPRAGTIVAIASSLAFCADPAGGGAFAGSGYDCDTSLSEDTFANLTIVRNGQGGQAGNSGEAIIAGLVPDADSSIAVSAIFDLDAGTYTFNLRGMMSDNSAAVVAGKGVYFGASELLLVFVPNN